MSMYPTSDRQLYFCQKIIPKGYTASAAVIKGADASGASRMTCYQGDIDGTTVSAVSALGVTFSSGAWTLPFSAATIVGDGEKFCSFLFDPGGTLDYIKGGKITIAKT